MKFASRCVPSARAWQFAAAAVLLTTACSEPAPPPLPPAQPVATAEARVQWYQACWDQFNNRQWDQFQNCYSENAVSESVDAAVPSTSGRAAIVERARIEAAAFPDRRGEVRMIFGNGDRLASIALYTGTNTGDMPGPDGKPMKPTGKAIGLLIGHVADLDATGTHVARDASYVEEGTMMAQLGLNPMPARAAEKASGGSAQVFIAKNDDLEKSNLAAAQAIFDAANKHDQKAIADMTPDDYKLIEVGRPKDMGKKESLAGMKEMFAAFSDLKMSTQAMWSARDYVIVEGTIEGTNTGDMPSMGLKKTGKKVKSRFLEIIRFEGGKPKDDYLFYNSTAFAAQLGLK